MSRKQAINNNDLISLIDHFPGGMGILDPKGNILALNSTIAKFFNKPREEIIGTNALSYLDENVSKTHSKTLKQISKDKKPIERIDYERGHWWKTIYQPILDNKGTVDKIAYYLQDITDKKEIELNLKNRENELEDTVLQLTTITENVKIGLYYTDVNGNFIWANKTAAEIAGKSRKEMIGKNGKYLFDTKSISKKDYLKALKLLALVKLGKKAGPEVFTIKQKDGMEKNIEIQTQRITLHGENVILGIVNDITDRKKAEKKQKESENKFQMLSDQSLMGLGIIQGEKIVYTNDAITQITGYSTDEMYREGAKILGKMVHPDDLSFVQEQLLKKLAGNKDVVTRYSCRIFSKTGEIKWVEVFSKTIEYQGKNADFVTFVDITALKKTEQTLKQSEQKFRDLADQSPNIIFINQKGKIVYVNQRGVDVMGYSRDEFFSDDFNFLSLIAPESRELVKIAFKKHSDGVDIKPYEYILVSKNGEKHNALITTKLIEYDGESAILGIVTDITQLKKSEMELQRGKDYLQNVIDNTSEIIFTIHTNLKIKTWNKTAEQITGYKQKQVVGKSIKHTNLFDYPSEIEEYINDIQNNKTAIIKEISINTIYGLQRTFSISPSFIKDESNNILEVLFVCRDITKQKQLHGKIQSSGCYLIKESVSNTAIETFNYLLQSSNRQGLYIGRISDKELQNTFKNIIPNIIKLSVQKDKRYPISNNIEEVYEKIKEFISKNDNTVVLIDRVDYLIINDSFESVIKTLYKINDLIQKHDSILLLRVNPLSMDQNQVEILNEDFKKLPSQKFTDIQISHNLYEILTYIQHEINNNFTVTFGNIGRKFSISKVTAKKRIQSLIDTGLISSRKQGKSKILNITEKGKNLLKQRKEM